MKFLCDNCKAKYQIADDKVSGKTVRMKCRKCGHQIEVRAAVTETSVASAPPQAPDAPKPAPRPGGLATSLSATKPRPAATSASTAPPGGALAGAFQRQLEGGGPSTVPYPSQAPGSVELSVTDEWYVAINGVPVGPVRLSELRRKAASGIITDDSLCWQEGLEEWRPIRSIAELAAIVREAAQQNRPSLVNPEPPERRSAPPPRPAARPAAARASDPPRPSAAPVGRSNVVPFHAPPARISTSDDAPMTAPVGPGAAAVALAAPQGTSPLAPVMQPMAQPLPAPPPAAAADPFALPPPAAGVATAADPFAMPVAAPTPAPFPVAPLARPSSVSLAPAAPAKKGVPIWFWLVGLFVVGFGGVAAFFLFKNPSTQVVVREVPVNGPATAAPDTKDDGVPLPPASGEPASTAAAGTAKAGSSGGPKIATNTGVAPPASAPKGLDLKGLAPSGAGPDVGPNGPSGAAGGGLDGAAVQRVVRERGPAVRRKCWDTATPDKSSVNVNVSVQVAANGQVSSASASGDDPVVTKCIEGQVRGWSFPAPGAPTTVNIPFHFVRQ